MADRRNYYKGQQVTEAELDAGFAGLESSLWSFLVDLGFTGIASGLAVSQHNPTPDLTVDIALGVAYDEAGRRSEVPSGQVLSLATDHLGVSTAVPNPGESRIVSVFIQFARADSDPRTDSDGNPVNFVSEESFSFYVVQGAASGSPSPPALESDKILLADVTIANGATQILTANISTARRQLTFQLSAGAVSINVGTVEEALQALLTNLNNHIDGTANKHPASAIDYSGSGTFADGSSLGAESVEDAIDEVVTKLASTTAAASGADKLGIDAITTWRGGRTNPATTVGNAIDKIVVDLSATTAGDDGAERIGFNASGNISATDVGAAIRELDTEKAALAGATFTGEVIVLRENVAFIDLGVIAANTQLANNVGLVRCQGPAATFNIALPVPASGHPVIRVVFVGPTSFDVFVCAQSNIATPNPPDYYGKWLNGGGHGAYEFAWTGTAWIIVSASGNVTPNGAGSFAT